MRVLSRAWIWLGALVVLATPLAPAFGAEPAGPPDTETLNRLQARFEGGRRARLVTPAGERVLVSPVFTPDGVRATEAGTDLALTPWSEIDRIDARGGRPKAGAVIGGLAGLGFGVFLGFAGALSGESGNMDFAGTALVWTGIGAVGGAAVGALAPGGWLQVYPEKPTGSAWGLEKRRR